jgi:hypothetical protein
VISDLLELLGVDGENLFQFSHFIEKILRDVRLGTWRAASQLVCYETLHDIWQPGCSTKQKGIKSVNAVLRKEIHQITENYFPKGEFIS